MHILQVVWNPNQVLIEIGAFQIRYYSLMFVIAFGLGAYLMKKIFLNENKSLEKLDSLFVYTAVATLVGARLGHVFFYDWAYFKHHLLEIFLPFRFSPEFEFTGFAGLASHGAAIGIILAMYLYIRKNPDFKLSWILDRLVIPVSIGGMFVRLGNFMNSEIIGKIVDNNFPLGIQFVRGGDLSAREAMMITQQNTPAKAYEIISTDPQFSEILASIPARHPAQLYEAVCYFFLFWILWYVYWKTNKKDQPYFIFGLFLVLLWTIRFFVEYVKESQGGLEDILGVFSTGQWLSIPFIILGFYLLFRKSKSVKS